jgi:eukaryotic-like serine/threonine-protein kinase
MIGQTLGLYHIVEKIGVGGMGEVYCAHDHQLDSDVALKVLPPGATADETARKLFRKEALALAKLNHPNIETVFEFSTQDEKDFLAMELIPGSSLREGSNKDHVPAELHFARVTQFVKGLVAAHKHGVVHRDLK